jgi:hypothetical protein
MSGSQQTLPLSTIFPDQGNLTSARRPTHKNFPDVEGQCSNMAYYLSGPTRSQKYVYMQVFCLQIP